jgi:hypothetical protein
MSSVRSARLLVHTSRHLHRHSGLPALIVRPFIPAGMIPGDCHGGDGQGAGGSRGKGESCAAVAAATRRHVVRALPWLISCNATELPAWAVVMRPCHRAATPRPPNNVTTCTRMSSACTGLQHTIEDLALGFRAMADASLVSNAHCDLVSVQSLMLLQCRYQHPWGVNHGVISDEELFKQLRDWTLAQVCWKHEPHRFLVHIVIHCCHAALVVTPVKAVGLTERLSGQVCAGN